ncbi:ABC transporter permease [Aminobacter anthyllidis]|uniref:ABC transporter permease n=1 Tax=Aminobacter anthyllidis TaxID=1035067 RepID=A0A9X1AE35_9HYPH|nr:ABC transporter permease [Aminobacter anthyllidis]MBT1158214.1 ABC transporter permease [Aminobacter anthyllidis]
MFDGFDVSWPLRLAIGIFTALVAVFLLAPSLIVVPMSFSASELLQFPPSEFSLRWWQQYWQSDLWMPATKTSLLLATVTAAGAVPIAFAAAYATTRSLGWAKLPLYAVLLMPATVPPILVAIGLFFVLARMHLVGSFPGLWLGHTVIAIPTAYVILSAGFARFDFTQEKAARSLGAGWWRSMFSVVIPQMRFSLLSAALLAFLTSLDEVIVSMFVGGGANTTLTKVMFLGLRDRVDPQAAVISTIWIVLVAIVVTVVFGRQRQEHS